MTREAGDIQLTGPPAHERTAATPPAAYREFSPPLHLRQHVVCFWHHPAEAPASGTAVLPDGCIDVIWTSHRPPIVAGPMTVPVIPTLTTGTELVGMRFRPGIAPFLLGVSARELVDRHVLLRDIWPARRHRPWAEATAGDDLAAKLAAIQTALTTRLASVDAVDPIVARRPRPFFN